MVEIHITTSLPLHEVKGWPEMIKNGPIWEKNILKKKTEQKNKFVPPIYEYLLWVLLISDNLLKI